MDRYCKGFGAILILTTGLTHTIAPAAASTRCDQYVSTAMAAARDNRRYSCGGTGPRFTSNAQAHRVFCENNHRVKNEAIIDSEYSARYNFVKACTDRKKPNGASCGGNGVWSNGACVGQVN